MRELVRFQALYQERVWGGRALATHLGRSLPEDRPIGESWEIVDRPEAQSIIQGGPLAGQTLRVALETHGEALLGPGWPAGRRFPLLVKWLDCRERLSLQVHPPAAVAPELRGEPKTENWFIAACSSGAHLLVGLQPGVTRARFEQALAEGTVESCVQRLAVQPGDSVLVRSGQVHAIDAGNLILEIQQNSDTTYRVYDWGRLGLDGRPRQLHLEESLRSILWDEPAPALVRAAREPAVLADAPEFRLRRVPLEAGEELRVHSEEQPRLLSVVEGLLRETAAGGGRLGRGDNVLLPWAGSFVFRAEQPALVLLTENFVGG